MQYERAKKILIEHREEHNELAGLLIEKEVIFIEDLERVFGKRPWTSRADELLLDSEENEKKAKPEEETTNLENPELENTETEPSAEA